MNSTLISVVLGEHCSHCAVVSEDSASESQGTCDDFLCLYSHFTSIKVFLQPGYGQTRLISEVYSSGLGCVWIPLVAL